MDIKIFCTFAPSNKTDVADSTNNQTINYNENLNEKRLESIAVAHRPNALHQCRGVLRMPRQRPVEVRYRNRESQGHHPQGDSCLLCVRNAIVLHRMPNSEGLRITNEYICRAMKYQVCFFDLCDRFKEVNVEAATPREAATNLMNQREDIDYIVCINT